MVSLVLRVLRPVVVPLIVEALAERDRVQRESMDKALTNLVSGKIARGVVGRGFNPGSGKDARY